LGEDTIEGSESGACGGENRGRSLSANCCEILLEVSALIESALARGEITVAHWE
jgi:hypothetical protein